MRNEPKCCVLLCVVCIIEMWGMTVAERFVMLEIFIDTPFFSCSFYSIRVLLICGVCKMGNYVSGSTLACTIYNRAISLVL